MMIPKLTPFELVRDTAEERLFMALKAIIYCGDMNDETFRTCANDIAKAALEDWAGLRSPELNCHGDTV